jgi:hypothetical protein
VLFSIRDLIAIRLIMSNYELLMLLSTIVTALGGVGFVVVMVQTYKGQMNAQIFIDLNQRYDDICKDFPRDAWTSRFNLESVLPEPSDELTLCMLRYLNLSSEEFYLYKRKYIRREVWKIWEGELLRTLRSPLLRREWKILASEFISYPEFFNYVEEIQNGSDNNDPRQQKLKHSNNERSKQSANY